jgi:hypothetical protein
MTGGLARGRPVSFLSGGRFSRVPCAGRLDQRVDATRGSSRGVLHEEEPVRVRLVGTCSVERGGGIARVNGLDPVRNGNRFRIFIDSFPMAQKKE